MSYFGIFAQVMRLLELDIPRFDTSHNPRWYEGTLTHRAAVRRKKSRRQHG